MTDALLTRDLAALLYEIDPTWPDRLEKRIQIDTSRGRFIPSVRPPSGQGSRSLWSMRDAAMLWALHQFNLFHCPRVNGYGDRQRRAEVRIKAAVLTGRGRYLIDDGEVAVLVADADLPAVLAGVRRNTSVLRFDAPFVEILDPAVASPPVLL